VVQMTSRATKNAFAEKRDEDIKSTPTI